MVAGPPFLGDNYPLSFVTFQPTWWLSKMNTYPAAGQGVRPEQYPVWWFVDQMGWGNWGNVGTGGNYPPGWDYETGQFNNRIEYVIPTLKQVVYNDDMTQDCSTLQVQFFNINTAAYAGATGGGGPMQDIFGNPGFMSFLYGSEPLNQELWNQGSNSDPYIDTYNTQFYSSLRENALLRWYFGYGPAGITWAEAINGGYVIQKGLWLVDEVSTEASSGIITLTCRAALGKNMIDPPLFPPIIPQGIYTSSGGPEFVPPMFCQPPGTRVQTIRHFKDEHGNQACYDAGCRCPACRATYNADRAARKREARAGSPRVRSCEMAPRCSPVEEVPIEAVKVGDWVPTWNSVTRQMVDGGRRVTRVGCRHYDGELVVVQTVDGHISRYTTEHPCIASLGTALTGKYVLYLMRRGDSYRLGQTKNIFNRVGQEKADALWVLAVYDTLEDVRLAEELTAYEFNVPTLVFEKQHPMRFDPSQFWSKVGDNSTQARACLRAFGRDIELPFYEPGTISDAAKLKHMRIMRACNLMDGMLVMIPEKARLKKNGNSFRRYVGRTSSSSIKVWREPYTGDVWSLDVDQHHTFVADGIITHNSTYNAITGLAVENSQGETPPGGTQTKDGYNRQVVDAVIDPDNNGYMLAITGGDLAAFNGTVGFGYGGIANIGQAGVVKLPAPIQAVTASGPSGNGYWQIDTAGNIWAFGDAISGTTANGNNISLGQVLNQYGYFAAPGVSGVYIVAAKANASGSGMWLMDNAGNLYTVGSGVSTFGWSPPAATFVDMSPMPNGQGLFLLDSTGTVHGVGAAAAVIQNLIAASQPTAYNVPGYTPACIESSGSGNGYRIVGNSNPYGQTSVVMQVFGDAQNYPPKIALPSQFAQPIVCVRRNSNDTGFWWFGADGGVFTFGQANFYGSLPQDYTLWVPSNYVSPFNTGASQEDYVIVPTGVQPPENAQFYPSPTGYATFGGALGYWADPVLLAPDYCVDEDTEALTKRGWMRYDEIQIGDEVLGVDPETGEGKWHQVRALFVGHRENYPMVEMTGVSFSALTTRNHRWLTWRGGSPTERSDRLYWTTSDAMRGRDQIPLSVPPDHLPPEPVVPDAWVELVAWFWTEGSWASYGCQLSQSRLVNGPNCDRIEACLTELYGPPGAYSDSLRPRRSVKEAIFVPGRHAGQRAELLLECGHRVSLTASKVKAKHTASVRCPECEPVLATRPWWSIDAKRESGVVLYNLSASIMRELQRVCDKEKAVSIDFLLSLTRSQLELFINVSMLADGSCNKERRRASLNGNTRLPDGSRGARRETLTQASEARIRSFEIACILAGLPVVTHEYQAEIDGRWRRWWGTTLRSCSYVSPVRCSTFRGDGRSDRGSMCIQERSYTGTIWCPDTELGNFVARRNASKAGHRYSSERSSLHGSIFLTGNCQIIRLLILWSGGWYPPSATFSAQTLEPIINTYPNPNEPAPILGFVPDSAAFDSYGPIDPSVFAQQPAMTAVKSLTQAIGYMTRFRDDGGLVCDLPNYYGPGNFIEDQDYAHTTYIPIIQTPTIQDLTFNSTDSPLRSTILVSPVDPYLYDNSPPFPNEADNPPGQSHTVTVYTPPQSVLNVLRGKPNVALIGVPLTVPISQADQAIMAEFEELGIYLAQQTGTCEAVYNPAINTDDQVQFEEQSTGVTQIGYITGVSVTHDLDTGDCLATYTFSRLASDASGADWVVAASGSISESVYNSAGELVFQTRFGITQTLLDRISKSSSPKARYLSQALG